MSNKTNIAVIYGGFSSEREVSIKSAENVLNNLNKDKYNIYKFDFKNDFKKFIKKCLNNKFDLVIPVLHGKNGEDGRIQGFLDILEIPYLFSGALTSAVSMDKYNTKKLVKEVKDLNIAKDIIVNKNDKYNKEEIINQLGLPLVIKPVDSGSSCGVTIVKQEDEFDTGISNAFDFSNTIIIEEFIKGREITVPVIKNNNQIKALPVIEIIPQISSWFDYKAKYEDNGSLEICPAELDNNISTKAQQLSEQIFKTLNCEDLARIDFILNNKNEIYFLEINTIPGLTKNSLTPRALKVENISIETFFDNLIQNKLN